MTNGVNIGLSKILYQQHQKIYEQNENRFLQQLSQKVKQPIDDLLKLVDGTEQETEINNAITEIENLITTDYILESGKSAESIKQEVARKILALDSELQVFGKDENIAGLKALADGNFNKAISTAKGATNFISNEELDKWISKIMIRIDKIKKHNSNSKFTGYLSNLKGAYLENAVVAELIKYIPKDIDIINTGNMRANSRQIAEDIMIIYGDDSKQNLANLMSENTKKRINIPIPIYEGIQKESGGLSVKAGSAPIKFYEGNLNKFFFNTQMNDEVDAYRNHIISVKNHRDNEKGRSVNIYSIASNLSAALGENNLFLSTRNNLLTRMSKKIEELYTDQKFLYMSGYKTNGQNISGRIVEPK